MITAVDVDSSIDHQPVQRHRDIGVHAEWMPLTGACGGSYSGDLIMAGMRCEVKGTERALPPRKSILMHRSIDGIIERL